MLLNEFIYFKPDAESMEDNGRYNPLEDSTVLKSSDLRKTPRLTLKVINDLRKAGDAREQEQKENLVVVRQMYAMPSEDEAAGTV
jgi:hypothetical protein